MTTSYSMSGRLLPGRVWTTDSRRPAGERGLAPTAEPLNRRSRRQHAAVSESTGGPCGDPRRDTLRSPVENENTSPDPPRRRAAATLSDRRGPVHVLFRGCGSGAAAPADGDGGDGPAVEGDPLRSRARALQDAGMPARVEVAAARQVHGRSILEWRLAAAPFGESTELVAADAVVCAQRQVAVTVVTADCLPILLASPREVMAVHAGWRGLVDGIVEAACARILSPRRGSPRSEITAWIGPAIGHCCYEVGPEVADAVARRAGCGAVRPGARREHVDLAGAAMALLRAHGIEDVRLSPLCTRCERRWASYRRDGPGAGRNLAAVWMADD
ncbi:MAG: laccase domain-containing protein [Acidobacteria bacterium]|nr:MAG: laccase domain-containing protein [Acidobacteriota bacterium]